MVRILLLVAAALAACTPSSKESDMPSPNPAPGTAAPGPSGVSNGQASSAPSTAGAGSGDQGTAARGPSPEPVSAAEGPGLAMPVDSPAEAQGRRTLSTAFVRVGPDGHLTVELRNARVLVLRNVVMRPKEYCGVQVLGGPAGAKYCGGYAEVAGARAGGIPVSEEPDLAVSNPLKPAKRK